MLQSEFEKRRKANLKALSILDKKSDLKVIDLVESLQLFDPSSPVVIQSEVQRYSIETVGVDIDGRVQIIVSMDGERLTNIL